MTVTSWFVYGDIKHHLVVTKNIEAQLVSYLYCPLFLLFTEYLLHLLIVVY